MPEEVLGLLGVLVEQSLVVVEPWVAGSETRYGMLEPVRQYASEKLEESGKGKETRRRHAAFFLDLAERADPELRGPKQAEWLEKLEQEIDNLRAAMSWALSAEDDDTAVRLGWALHRFWWYRGHQREAHRWMETALEHELPPALRTRALVVATSMAFAQGDYTTAEKRVGEALDLSKREGDVFAEAHAWGGMGMVEMVRQDYQAAASSLEKGIALFERCSEDHMASTLRVLFGTTLVVQGEGVRAERIFEEALVSARRLRVPSLTYIALYNSAQSALARGDRQKATRMLEEGIEWSVQVKDKANLMHFMEALAAVKALGGEAERCALLLGAAEALQEEVGARVYSYYVPNTSLQERAAYEARAAIGQATFEKARERGWAMSLEQAVANALKNDASPT